jgi:hypothetical protein
VNRRQLLAKSHVFVDGRFLHEGAGRVQEDDAERVAQIMRHHGQHVLARSLRTLGLLEKSGVHEGERRTIGELLAQRDVVGRVASSPLEATGLERPDHRRSEAERDAHRAARGKVIEESQTCRVRPDLDHGGLGGSPANALP